MLAYAGVLLKQFSSSAQARLLARVLSRTGCVAELPTASPRGAGQCHHVREIDDTVHHAGILLYFLESGVTEHNSAIEAISIHITVLSTFITLLLA